MTRYTAKLSNSLAGCHPDECPLQVASFVSVYQRPQLKGSKESSVVTYGDPFQGFPDREDLEVVYHHLLLGPS